jgi:hypothetical protein
MAARQDSSQNPVAAAGRSGPKRRYSRSLSWGTLKVKLRGHPPTRHKHREIEYSAQSLIIDCSAPVGLLISRGGRHGTPHCYVANRLFRGTEIGRGR